MVVRERDIESLFGCGAAKRCAVPLRTMATAEYNNHNVAVSCGSFKLVSNLPMTPVYVYILKISRRRGPW